MLGKVRQSTLFKKKFKKIMKPNFKKPTETSEKAKEPSSAVHKLLC